MTVYSKQAFLDKDPDKAKLEEFKEVELPPAYEDDVETVTTSVGTSDGAAVYIEAQRRRRRSALCLLVFLLFILAASVLGGLYLYEHFMKQKIFKTWCGIRSSDGRSGKEHVELDLVGGAYERVDVPRIDEFTEARFVHDFSMNLSAIIDANQELCYVMKLNRTIVSPPKSFLDLIVKMMEGEYDYRADTIRENYRVIRPEIQDFTSVGKYIEEDCRFFHTYWISKISNGRWKRSVTNGLAKQVLVFEGRVPREIRIFN